MGSHKEYALGSDNRTVWDQQFRENQLDTILSDAEADRGFAGQNTGVKSG